ncbi:MAG: ABC transporter ATP-binding protein/permease [Erysipelotrichaceae bacterium]|nr:ABC transporter ATP-binding protein/permease [Erysipelotrichaceae bacterium]
MFNKRLILTMNKEMKHVKLQVLFQILSLVCNIIFTFLLVNLFSKLIYNTLTFSILLLNVLLIIIILLIRAFFLKQVSSCSFNSSTNVKRKLRKDLFEKILRLSNSYNDSISTSELVQLATEGINQLEVYFSLYLPQLFYSVISAVILFITLSFFDLKSSIALFICVPLIPISIVLVQKFAKKLLSKYWLSYVTLGSSFLENLEGLTTLKIYGSDDYKQKEMNIEAENFRKATMRVLIMQLNSISIMDIVAYGGAALGSYLAISHFISNEISLFATLLIILLAFEFFIPLRQLGSYFHIAMNGIAASDKLFYVLDIKEKDSGSKDISGDINIKFEDLTFAYKNHNVLENLNLTIKSNEFTAIVGESGSGKSTIAKLIMGYYQKYNGNIFINNIDRNLISDDSIMENIAFINHDPHIFKGTIKENIDLLNIYDDLEINKVLEEVNLLDFVNSQNGLETLVLENGSNLSGGQKQRLNIARSLLKKPNMFIFDEVTSNIDVESEEKILNVIKKLSKSKTILMITHRLSTIKDCDEIIVLEKGCVVENGKHNELINNKKTYYQMYEVQKELEAYYE